MQIKAIIIENYLAIKNREGRTVVIVIYSMFIILLPFIVHNINLFSRANRALLIIIYRHIQREAFDSLMSLSIKKGRKQKKDYNIICYSIRMNYVFVYKIKIRFIKNRNIKI